MKNERIAHMKYSFIVLLSISFAHVHTMEQSPSSDVAATQNNILCVLIHNRSNDKVKVYANEGASQDLFRYYKIKPQETAQLQLFPSGKIKFRAGIIRSYVITYKERKDNNVLANVKYSILFLNRNNIFAESQTVADAQGAQTHNLKIKIKPGGKVKLK